MSSACHSAAEDDLMIKTSTPHIWLGRRWYAWLEFGPDSSRATLKQIAQQVCDEFGGSVTEVLPGPRDEDKEYVELSVGTARLLLMRKPGLGLGLGAGYPDVPQLLRIAVAFGAERRGWRWPLYRLWQQLFGSGRPAKQFFSDGGSGD